MNVRLLLAALSLAALQVEGTMAQELQSTDLARSARECAADPAYEPGGAMVGDCLLDRAAKIEPEIDAVLHRASKRFCDAESRKRLRQVQTQWRAYRQAFCSLVEDFPGNTPAYVNAGACHLQLTQQRMEALLATGEAAYAWCNALFFDDEASRFGAPPDETVRQRRSGIEWRVSASGGEILVSREGKAIASLDAAGCFYCEGRPDCSEGVFLFDYPSPTVKDPYFTDHALLHACSAEDGSRLELVSDLLASPRTTLRETHLPPLDWRIDYDMITITLSDGTQRTWAAPEAPEN